MTWSDIEQECCVRALSGSVLSVSVHQFRVQNALLVALFDEVVRSVEIQYQSNEFRRSEFRAILFHLFCTVQILVLNNAWERLWEVL